MLKRYTPKEIAAIYKCKIEKILGWIASGELAAINVASKLNGGKPRWVVTPESLADFERRRTIVVAPKTITRSSRRRESNDVPQIF